jgi:eukaryotic-like serine/threonine-protein kinase
MSTGPELLLERIRAATADEYQIEREIGRGGMAAVFLARDLALDRRVAIKVMLPDLIDVQGVQDRFVIEARTAAHLDHPGIVTVYAVRQRGGLLFIVMKFIEGHTLEAVLRSQGQLDPAAAALIGSRVARALEYAHDAGVVHRDVKPSNIMIDTRGRPVVTDFGIARVLTAQSITVAGSMLGTPTHMSPEQCRGLPATAASDQYSLGVTMYETLTGRVPFTGSLFELIDAHREQAPPPLSEFVAGVDRELEQTVMRMLAKDPLARWGSLSEVVQRLAAHTTQSHGGDSYRATLVLSGGSSLPTPDHGIAAVDVLTPPDGAPRGASAPVTPTTPVSISGPPSPIPFTTPPSPVAPVPPGIVPPLSTPVATEPPATTRPNRRPLLIGAGLVAAVVVVAALASRAGSGGPGPSESAPSATQTVSTPAAPAPAALTAADSITRDSVSRAARDSVVRDSVVRDSTARALAVKDSIARDSTARGAAANALASKALAPKPVAPRATAAKDSARVPKVRPVRPESLAVECARLLERVSLGEKLTDAERGLLRQRCPK